VCCVVLCWSDLVSSVDNVLNPKLISATCVCTHHLVTVTTVFLVISHRVRH
jgi:hypothetical protein